MSKSKTRNQPGAKTAKDSRSDASGSAVSDQSAPSAEVETNMQSNPEKPSPDTAAKDAQPSAATPAPSRQRGVGKSSALPLVAVILSLIALLGTLFGFYRTDVSQRMTSVGVTSKVDSFVGRFDDVRSNVQQLEQKLDGLNDKFTTLSSDVSERVSAISNTVGENESKFKTSLAESLSGVKSDVQETVTSSRGKVDDALTELKASTNEKVEAINAELAALKSQVAEEVAASKRETVANIETFRAENLKTVEAKQTDNAAALNEIRAELGELSGTVNATAQQLNHSLGTWQLQEVEQLMTMADQRLQLSGDVAIAETALTLAEQRIAELDDPETTELRALITDELQALKAVPRVDVEGLALRIRTVADGIDDFALAPVVTPDAAAAPNQETTQTDNDDGATSAAEQDGSWLGSIASSAKNLGKEIGSDFGDLVKIREASGPRKPLMTPEQEYFLRQNLRLMLQSAQLALLRGDQATYQANLTSSADWLAEYFDSDAADVGTAQQALTELAAVEVAPQVPDITASLSAIRKLNQMRASQ